jgi:hypothetical protein
MVNHVPSPLFVFGIGKSPVFRWCLLQGLRRCRAYEGVEDALRSLHDALNFYHGLR